MASPGNESQPNGKIWFLIILVSLTFVASLTYFSRNNPDLTEFNKAQIGKTPDARAIREYTVYYNTGVFSPTNIRVHAGDSVKFQNDSTDPIHVATDTTDGIPDVIGLNSVRNIPPSNSYTFTFLKAGTFGYHNELNKSERGTVIVRP